MVFKKKFFRNFLIVVFFIFFWFNPFLISFVKAEGNTENLLPGNLLLDLAISAAKDSSQTAVESAGNVPKEEGQIIDVDNGAATFSAKINDNQEASGSGTIEEGKILEAENRDEEIVEKKVVNDINEFQTGQSLKEENSERAQIKTSEALAAVNLLNLSNTNVSSSDFEFSLINLTEEKKEEIRLGESDLIEDKESPEIKVVISDNQEEINLENNVQVLASTGRIQVKDNEEEKEIVVKTGEATALANVINIVNTNILNSEFFFEVVNILSPTENDLILSYPEGLESSLSFPQNENEDKEVEISNHLEVQALTGSNEEINNGGDNVIVTGKAQAQANIFSLANLDFYHDDYSLLVVNDLGNWTGGIKGDLSTEIMGKETEGENQGEEDATEEKRTILKNNIQISALTGENQISENQGSSSIQTGEARSLANLFNLVNLNILESHFFVWVVNILDSWSGDIIFAYSDEDTSEENGEAKEIGRVVSGETKEEVSQKQPKLEISVKNNVGEFVYLGDTITFEITVRNIGEAPVYNTRLIQELLSETFGDFGSAEFDLGIIEAGKSGRLSFGLKLIDNGELLPGLYETRSLAKGFAPNGWEVVSNEDKTSFVIKTKEVSFPVEVKADNEREKTLGSTVMINQPKRRNLRPYLLLFFLILLYLLLKLLKRKKYLKLKIK